MTDGHSPHRLLSRRHLLGAGGLLALSAGGLVLAGPPPRLPTDPFTLGVASGDPLPDGFVLWTRLAPDPLNGGGMPPAAYEIAWEVAADERLEKVIRRGTARAAPEGAHAVHVEVAGLDPGRPYWYRFRVGEHASRIGRARTAPAPDARPDRLAFAVASCQDWQNGYYAAYAAMAAEELDFVLHLGDYIYEGGPGTGTVREHNGPALSTLADYRNRHALYKTDPSLQAAHALFPFLVTWDDHEVADNYAGPISEANDPEAQFLARRAAAYQAYYEHMPLRKEAIPRGPDLRLYRSFRFGDLATLCLLDTRQYRSNQPCEEEPAALVKARCPRALDPAQTMTGAEQERWLFAELERSPARWNAIGQQTILAQFDFRRGAPAGGMPGGRYNLDQWDGYIAARDRLLRFLDGKKIANPVVLTGDIHSSWVHDLKLDFNDPKSRTVGTEFVGTSISSSFPQILAPLVTAALADNPHTRFFDGLRRGYVRCHLTRDQCRADFRVIPTEGPRGSVRVREAPATTLASFVVQHGVPGAVKA